MSLTWSPMSSASEIELEVAAGIPLPVSSSTLNINVPESTHSSQVSEFAESEAGVEITNEPRNVSSLAPTDNGFKAWSFLISAFLVEVVVWGFPTSFGVLLNAYMRDEKYSKQPHAALLLPLIGTLSTGIIYCSGPFIFPFTHRYPIHRRTCMWIGISLCWISLFSASYVINVDILVLLQGLLYAIGGSLLYQPCISFMSEWFVRKRGLANGVISAGTAVGGLILPLLLPRLIGLYGPAKTVRILSWLLLGTTLPIMPFLRPRLPEIRVRGPDPGARNEGLQRNLSWLRDPVFLLVMLATITQSFGYFVPILWLPTYASELNLSDADASLTVALLNGFAVFSRIGLGTLADRYSPWILAVMTNTFTSIATFVLWGIFSRNYAGLLAYGIAYGIFASGWSSLFTGFIKPVAKDNPNLSTTLLGFLLLCRGLGNILSTPISSALSKASTSDFKTTHPSSGFNMAGGRYAKMILYVGTCFAGTGIIALLGLVMERPRGRRWGNIIN